MLLAICCLVIIARLAVRAWKRLWTFWISDLFLVLALLTFMTLAVGDTYSFSKGHTSLEEYYDEGFTKVSTAPFWHLILVHSNALKVDVFVHTGFRIGILSPKIQPPCVLLSAVSCF